MLKVAFIGAQNCGKTTMAKELSSHYRKQELITDYVPEVARDLICRWGAPFQDIADGMLIFEQQVEKEIIVPAKTDIMFCDVAIYINAVYALFTMLSKSIVTVREQDYYINLYRKSLNKLNAYDLVFFLEPFPVEGDDGVRSNTLVEENQKISIMMKAFLDLHQIEYCYLDCDSYEANYELAEYIINGRKI